MPLDEKGVPTTSNSDDESPPTRRHRHASRERHDKTRHDQRGRKREHKHHRHESVRQRGSSSDQKKIEREVRSKRNRSDSPSKFDFRREGGGDIWRVKEERKHHPSCDDNSERKREIDIAGDKNQLKGNKNRNAKMNKMDRNGTPERPIGREQHYHEGGLSKKEHLYEERKRSVTKESTDDDRKYRLHKRLKEEVKEDERAHFLKKTATEWSRSEIEGKTSKAEKEMPNFEPSGKLAEDTNTYRGVVIKYNEPPDARKPKLRWRLYPFKGNETLPVLYIHRQSAYLIGRDRRIADLPVDHPSCSKQHAVFQYRLVPVDLEDGTTVKRIRPYIIDLGSANGTYLNGERIEPERFFELREKDILKFGFSTREFVLLNENSNEGDTSDAERPKRSPSSSP